VAAGQRRNERGRRTDEFLQSLPALLAGRAIDVGSGDGAVAVRVLPPAPMPTVWIGGSSPVALHRTVRFGDGWLGAFLTPAEFAETSARLRELAAAAGRPMPRLGLVTHATIGRVDDRSLHESGAALLRSAYGLPTERAEQLVLAGSPTRVADRLAEYVAIGAEQLVVINDRGPWEQACDLLADTRSHLTDPVTRPGSDGPQLPRLDFHCKPIGSVRSEQCSRRSADSGRAGHVQRGRDIGHEPSRRRGGLVGTADISSAASVVDHARLVRRRLMRLVLSSAHGADRTCGSRCRGPVGLTARAVGRGFSGSPRRSGRR